MRYTVFTAGGDANGMDECHTKCDQIYGTAYNRRHIRRGCLTWAVFSCDGPMPEALQEVYDAPGKYPKGTLDEKYHSEIWIPVRKRAI